jgi:hypothetical protein
MRESDLPPNLADKDFDAISHSTRCGEIGYTHMKQVEVFASREGDDWLVISVVVKYF